MKAKIPLILTVLGLVSVGSGTGTISTQQALAQEEDNKAIVIGYIRDVYDNRNVSAIDRYIADNYSVTELTISDVVDGGGSDGSGGSAADNFTTAADPRTEKEQLKVNLTALHKSFPDLTRSLEHIMAVGDRVAMFNTWNGTFSGDEYLGIPPNGNPFTVTTADLFRISDGQIVEQWSVNDLSNLTKALSPELPEAPNGS